MPPYITLRNHTYYFRQSVSSELRSLIGKREIKKSLGSNYPAAVSLCKKLAVEADKAICDARVQLDSIPVDPFSSEGIRRTRPVPLTEVTLTSRSLHCASSWQWATSRQCSRIPESS